MEVIKLEVNAQGELFSTSLEIARVTEKKHKSVLRDIREEIGTNVSQSKYTDKANRKQNYYILDEYQTLQVMSRYSRDVRKMVINEFKRMKEYIKSQQQPKNYDEMSLNNKAIALIGEMQERNLYLEQENKQLMDRNKQVTGVLEAIQTHGDNLLFREFVKIVYSENGITIGEQEFRELLRKHKYIDYKNFPYAQYKQYFNVNEGTKNGHPYATTRLTPRGRLYFTEKLIKMYKKEK